MKKAKKKLSLSKDTLMSLADLKSVGGIEEWTRPIKGCILQPDDTYYPVCQVS